MWTISDWKHETVATEAPLDVEREAAATVSGELGLAHGRFALYNPYCARPGSRERAIAEAAMAVSHKLNHKEHPNTVLNELLEATPNTANCEHHLTIPGEHTLSGAAISITICWTEE